MENLNKEKQIEEKAIEEMAKIIAKADDTCRAQTISKTLYNAGYRKQSEGEWLSSPDGIQPIRCSKCNMPAPFVAGENEFGDFEICRYPSRYCHECGAKMKGGEQ